jgi:hypothetical protein
LRSNSYSSILDTTTVLLLDALPENLHVEDDAVVSSPPPTAAHTAWRRPNACTAARFPCCGPGSTPLPGTLIAQRSRWQRLASEPSPTIPLLGC